MHLSAVFFEILKYGNVVAKPIDGSSSKLGEPSPKSTFEPQRPKYKPESCAKVKPACTAGSFWV